MAGHAIFASGLQLIQFPQLGRGGDGSTGQGGEAAKGVMLFDRNFSGPRQEDMHRVVLAVDVPHLPIEGLDAFHHMATVGAVNDA